MLQQRLALGIRPDAVARLHRRANAWYAQHDAPNEAVAHALAAQSWAGAAELIEHYGVELASRGQTQQVRDWLNALPEPTIRERPLLAAIDAGNLLLTNQPAAAERRLREAEAAERARPQEARDGRTQGYIAMVWATLLRALGDVEGSFAQARRALELLPDTDIFATTAAVAATHIFWERGDATPAAEQQSLEAVSRAQTATNLISMSIGAGHNPSHPDRIVLVL